MSTVGIVSLSVFGLGVVLFLSTPMIGKAIRGDNEKFTDSQGLKILLLMIASLLLMFIAGGIAYFAQP